MLSILIIGKVVGKEGNFLKRLKVALTTFEHIVCSDKHESNHQPGLHKVCILFEEHLYGRMLVTSLPCTCSVGEGKGWGGGYWKGRGGGNWKGRRGGNWEGRGGGNWEGRGGKGLLGWEGGKVKVKYGLSSMVHRNSLSTSSHTPPPPHPTPGPCSQVQCQPEVCHHSCDGGHLEGGGT